MGGACPQSQLAVSGIIVANAIYDTLVVVNSKGEYVPFLAKSITPNATYDQWTIELRDGVKFHDGTPLDADAVKLNLDTYRGLNPKLPGRLTPFVFSNVADVTVTGPLHRLRHHEDAVARVPGVALRRRPLRDHGPGPAQRPEHLCVQPHRHRPVREGDVAGQRGVRRGAQPRLLAGGPAPPRPDPFRPVTDSTARVSQFEGGELDVMHTSSVDGLVALREYAKAGKAQLFESTAGGEVAYMMLNSSKPPFDDILARQAVAYGRNTAEINQIRNRSIPVLANGPFSPGSMGAVADSGLPKPNLKKARKLAAEYEAKHGSKISFEYLTNPEPDTLAIAQLVKEQAAKVGIDVSIRTVDQATLISEALAGNFQAMGFRNHAASDPDAQYNWWHTGSPVNFGRINDPEIDRLLDAGRVETDPAKRTEIYEDLTRRFGEELWNLWSWYHAVGRRGATRGEGRPRQSAPRRSRQAGVPRRPRPRLGRVALLMSGSLRSLDGEHSGQARRSGSGTLAPLP